MDKIKNENGSDVSDFRKPFDYGWRREFVFSINDPLKGDVFYISPAGIKCRTKHEVIKQLDENLQISMFSFAKRELGFKEEISRQASAKGCTKKSFAQTLSNTAARAQSHVNNKNCDAKELSSH